MRLWLCAVTMLIPSALMVTAQANESTRGAREDVTAARLRGHLEGHEGRVMSAHFLPAGDRLVTVARDHRAILWDVLAMAPIKAVSIPQEGVNQRAALSPDGRTLAVVGSEPSLVLWDLETDVFTPKTFAGYAAFDVAFSLDGSMLAVSTISRVFVWDLARGRLISTAHTERSNGSALAFSADDRALVVAGFMQLWFVDPTSGSWLREPIALESPIGAVAFSPSGMLAVSTIDRGVALFPSPLHEDTHHTLLWPRGQKRSMLEGVAFVEEARLWAVGTGKLYGWDLPVTERYAVASHIADDDATGTLAVSADHRVAAAGAGHHRVAVWDLD
ncbi:MAG: hypothetical protein AAGA68_24480 [Pseudomonadota bacterium]